MDGVFGAEEDGQVQVRFKNRQSGKRMASEIMKIGDRFGRLVVAKFLRTGKRYTKIWLCNCDCGKSKEIPYGALTSGATVSCGCYHKDVLKKQFFKHGQVNSPTYSTWEHMKGRCLNPKNDQFFRYGGRGITICDRWKKFENFLADMGERPEGKSIDRINNNGNYEPGNCRWATLTEQANNMRSNRNITYFGKTLSMTQWAKTLGINPVTISGRIHRSKLTNPELILSKVSRTDGGIVLKRRAI